MCRQAGLSPCLVSHIPKHFSRRAALLLWHPLGCFSVLGDGGFCRWLRGWFRSDFFNLSEASEGGVLSKLSASMASFARSAGGSFKTVSDRVQMVERFADHLRLDLNIQIQKVEHIHTKHVQAYIAFRQDGGIQDRTLQNEMAGLRAVLNGAGRSKLAGAEALSNEALGIAGASRSGSKTAISDERYQAALSAAGARDEGVALALALARNLGLRSEEAVQAAQSLGTWERALQDGALSLPVTFGTKGGRLREVTVIPSERENVQSLVSQCLTYASEHKGRLVDRPSLKQAMDRFHNVARSAGLTGQASPHSLRYAWAQDRARAYQSQGFSKQEAYARVACDLGHGSGRGRYMEQVYSK